MKKLDTNVVASAMLWGGNPKRLLQARREKRVELFASVAMLAELTDILGRTKFEKKIAASLLTVDQLVDGYAALTQVVRPMPTPRIVADPDDDVLVGTALAARADLVVTGDHGLLDVGTYQGVRIDGVTTKRFNEQVRRNLERFPEDFMFQLSGDEWATLKTGRGQHRKYLPYAFTEHGAIMAATIRNSPRATEVSVYVVRAFVALREMLAGTRNWRRSSTSWRTRSIHTTRLLPASSTRCVN